MIRLPPVGSLLVLAAALAGCGGAEVRAPGSAPVADATGAAAPAPPSTPPSTVTPEMVRRDSPLIFHAVVRLDQGRGAGLEPVSDEWYAPATGAYRFELGLFADTTRPDAAMRQLRPGDDPGGAHAWWLSPQFAGRSAVFASVISIDHPTPDDPASTYTVVYLDAAGRQQDDRRRSQTWPAMPDAGSGIPNSIVITTKAGDPFPCGPATTSPAVVADGTPVSVLIYDGSPGACVQDGHDTIRITAPAAELHSIIAHLARVRA